MQVRYGEGVAIHTDPESCAGIREGAGEALIGGRIGVDAVNGIGRRGSECAGLSNASYRHRACSTHGRTSGFASPTQGKSRMS